MSLDHIVPMERVREEIGEERARRVEKFRELVWNRRVEEARAYYEEEIRGNREAETDIRHYAELHLKVLSFALSGF